MLGALPTGPPRETKRLSSNPEGCALFAVTVRLERVATFSRRDLVTDVRERCGRVRVKRTDDGSADVAAILSVVPTGNGGSVACPLPDSIEGLERVYCVAKHG